MNPEKRPAQAGRFFNFKPAHGNVKATSFDRRMISVPYRMDDIPCGYDICIADDIRSRMKERIVYHTAFAVYHMNK